MKILGVLAIVTIVFVFGFLIGQWRLQEAAGLAIIYTGNAGWTVSTVGGSGACEVSYEVNEAGLLAGYFRCQTPGGNE